MPTVVAIFDQMDALERARSALERAGLGDEVTRVVDQSDVPSTEPAPVAASPLAGGTAVNRTGRTHPLAVDSSLGRLDLPDEEAEFVAQSVQDGARLLVMDTRRPADAAAILEPMAQRVIAAD